MASNDSRVVTAYYRSLDDQNEFSVPLSAPCTDTSTSDRTKYLSELRLSSKKLQASINNFLTEKMERDKLHNGNQSGAKIKIEDELEEHNYGEEQAETED